MYFLPCILSQDTEDLTGLVRKYLPPGTIYDTYQFYCGWCSAHSIEHQAGHQVKIIFVFLVCGELCIYKFEYIYIYACFFLVSVYIYKNIYHVEDM